MKTYVLTLSHSFPANHAMHGKPTYFREKFLGTPGMLRKLHTIRANYTLWAKRFEKIAAGDACLSVREWMDAPYRSKQREIARLTKEDGIGIQLLRFHPDADGFISWQQFDIDGHYNNIINVANNDGLTYLDWRRWFRNYDLSKPLAIIHFTKFRY